MSIELYKIAFGQLKGIGPSRASKILGKLSSLVDFFSFSERELYLQTGIARSILKEMRRDEAKFKAEQQLVFNEKNDVQTHFFMDENYPRRLRQCPDAPIVLFSKGVTDLNRPKIVSIVGTRNQTEYGRGLTNELLSSIETLDLTVISGLAYGVDIHVHETCIEKSIYNLGVFGHSLDRIYPYQHRKIAQKMLEHGGWISEFIVGTKPDRMNFPMRNRIIAGMSDAIVVIESKRKGGSMITAELGNDYNRDVFAFPGSVHHEESEGCNWLIQKQKAHLIQNGADFLTWMNWGNALQKKQIQLFPELDSNEKQVYECLIKMKEAHVDRIAMSCQLSTSQINVLLFQLEMKNMVRGISGNRYQLVWQYCA
jgi:DNA processing protein